MKYAIKVPIDDGGWLYVTETKEDGICDIATYDTFEKAEEYAKLWKNGIVVECQYTEAERLRAKKQAIKEELYDKVKMEMFKASSKLEGIDYDKIPGTIKNMDHEQLEEYAWWLYKRVGELERERKFSKVSRVEVIGPEKREYVRYFNEEEFMNWGLQDDDRTLKIFVHDGNKDFYED